MHSPIDLSKAVVFSKPFPHFHVASAIAAPFGEELLTWFESGAPWKLKIASFYEQYEFPGQRIRIHNDFIPGRETHRLLLQLNRDWSEDCGGMLLMFQRPQPDGISRMIQPSSCSALGFAISPDSHHAVSTVHKGQRFTLVYSFYGLKPLDM